jgi:hypothetical protein
MWWGFLLRSELCDPALTAVGMGSRIISSSQPGSLNFPKRHQPGKLADFRFSLVN